MHATRYVVNSSLEVGEVLYRVLEMLLVVAVQAEFQFFGGRQSKGTTVLHAAIGRASSCKAQGNAVVCIANSQRAFVFANAEFNAHVDGTAECYVYCTSGARCCYCCQAGARNQELFHVFSSPKKIQEVCYSWKSSCDWVSHPGRALHSLTSDALLKDSF